MAEKHVTLTLTTSEEQALARLVAHVCNQHPQVILSDVFTGLLARDNCELIGRINGALNANR